MLKSISDISKILIIMLGKKKWLIYLLILSQILVGIIPALLLYVIGQAVESIAQLQYYNSIIIALGAILLLCELTEMLERIVSSILSDTAQKNLKQMLIEKSTTPPNVEHFSDSYFQDVFFLTEKNVNEVSDFITQCSFLMTGFLGIFSISVLLTSLDWWIPLLLIVGVLPIIFFKFQLEAAIWNIETANAKGFKFLTLAYENLTRKTSAKELRLNDCTSLLKRNWDSEYSSILNEVHVQRFKGLIKLFLISLPGVILIVATLFYIGSASYYDHYDISQLVILFGAILQIRNQLMIIVANFTSFSAVFLSASTILKLLQCHLYTTECRSFDASCAHALSVDSVSFKYPGADFWVLNNISFSIEYNTLTVIVAPNGAGKSTLINIITGMYQRFTGNIKIGVDAATKVWGINQSFTLPSLTLHEFLDPYGKCELVTIRNTLINYQLGHLVDKLNCYLDSRFEGSIELSGGQWQRLALVNVELHYQQYQLIVLDELNSALDSAGDALYLKLLLRMKKTSTVIIVSHKNDIHMYCDNIIKLA